MRNLSAAPILCFSILVVAQPDSAHAQNVGGDMCPAPISVCRRFPVAELDAGGLAPVPIAEPCPDGYRCACVPSCPLCADCAAEVCIVADKEPECRTACDCDPGLGCFDGRCIAGFAPVYCCDADVCPAGEQCQHADGRMDHCDKTCNRELWLCSNDGSTDALQQADVCGDQRECRCTASCPDCDDCGPPVCVPPDAPAPYRCDAGGGCANPGDICACAASCPECDDCALGVCVPGSCAGPTCEERVNKIVKRTKTLVRKANRCRSAGQCVHVNTDTECMGTCGAWIRRRHVKRFNAILDHADKRICGTYQTDGCPYATPGCIAERPACIRGRCRGVRF